MNYNTNGCNPEATFNFFTQVSNILGGDAKSLSH